LASSFQLALLWQSVIFLKHQSWSSDRATGKYTAEQKIRAKGIDKSRK
jgi:hypothetical protein